MDTAFMGPLARAAAKGDEVCHLTARSSLTPTCSFRLMVDHAHLATRRSLRPLPARPFTHFRSTGSTCCSRAPKVDPLHFCTCLGALPWCEARHA
jgi:hypothetical protein